LTPTDALASRALLSNDSKALQRPTQTAYKSYNLSRDTQPYSDMDNQTGAGATAGGTPDFDQMSVHELKSWLTNHGVDLTGEVPKFGAGRAL